MKRLSARFWVMVGVLVSLAAITGTILMMVLSDKNRPPEQDLSTTPVPTYSEEDFRVVYPFTLEDILEGQLPCPSIPEGFRASQAAVGEAGYHHGEIFIDARVDTSTCDATSEPIVKKAKGEVLRWWVKRCEGDYTLVGKVVKFHRPGDMLREIFITQDMVAAGCEGLYHAKNLASSPQ